MARTADSNGLGEFDIIARYLRPLAPDPAALGLSDDAACLSPPPGADLIITTDAVVEGVHFLPNDPPDSIGHKALAVNLSDLAAKGAEPLAYLLNLCLPTHDGALARSSAWLESLAEGLGQLQAVSGIGLIGGDTTATPGPLTLAITALGTVPNHAAILRSGAKPGDRLYATGTIGDAYLGLRLERNREFAAKSGLSAAEAESLIGRYRRPEPRNRLAAALRRHASAAIDISDGLLGDLAKLAAASGTGALLHTAKVPLSAPARQACTTCPDLLAALITGGDDYEILASISPNEAAAFEAAAESQAIPVTAIGEITEPGQGVKVCDPSGAPLALPVTGYSHFGA